MSELATLAMDAHGGLDRWRELKTVSARLFQDGVLWKLKGQDGVLRDVHVTVDLHEEWASHRPFGHPDRHTSFRPERVAIETSNGDVVEERLNPRESFKGHVLDTPWDSLQLAYFAGYAMWTYLNTPFLFALPGVETEEIGPWQENGETWRRLKVTFPAGIATHSAGQTFYFDQSGLLKRQDYGVDVSGGTAAAHYVSELEEFSGILVPTKHTIFGRQPDGKAAPAPLVVSIDVRDVKFS
ncbi:MAG: hypothetical protein DMF54_16260 [Acidobacteria bacterium]|nr:MAG: hypothetical protein DMF54_16260 [Acidobacteriota bacterium]